MKLYLRWSNTVFLDKYTGAKLTKKECILILSVEQCSELLNAHKLRFPLLRGMPTRQTVSSFPSGIFKSAHLFMH